MVKKSDLDKELAAYEKKLQVERELAVLEQKRSEAAKDIGNDVKQSVGSYLKISETSSSIAGKMTRMLMESRSIGQAWDALKKTVTEVYKSLTSLLSPTNILASLMDNIVSQTKDFLVLQDKMASNFEKSVGNASKFQGEMIGLYSAGLTFAATMEDVAAAYSQLKEELVDFEDITSKERTSLGLTTLQLNKLGVETKNLVDIQATMHKSMGLSVAEVTKLEKQLYGTAIAMGRPPKQIIADFSTMAPKLAGYGKNMITVFLDLENAAKATGIKVNELLGISEKFDTFDSAAESVGKLNALLGGDYFDTQKIMSLNDAERIKYLQEQLQLSGKSFESMSRMEQKELARAMQLKDVSELQALYNNQTAKTESGLTSQEKSQQLMNRGLSIAVTLSEKLESVWKELGLIFGPVLTPIVPMIKDLAGKIQGWIRDFRTWLDLNPQFITKIKGYWNDFTNYMGEIWDKYIKPVVNQILGFFGTDTDSLSNIMKGGFDGIPQMVDNFVASIKQIPTKLEQVFNTISPTLTKMKDKVVSTFTDENGDIRWGRVAVGTAATAAVGMALSDTTEKTAGLTKETGLLGGTLSGLGDGLSGLGDVMSGFGVGIGGLGVGVYALSQGLKDMPMDKLEQFHSFLENIFLTLGVTAAGGGILDAILGKDTMGEQFKGLGIGIAIAAVGFGLFAFAIENILGQLEKTAGKSDQIKNFMVDFAKSLNTALEQIDSEQAFDADTAEDFADAITKIGEAGGNAIPILTYMAYLYNTPMKESGPVFKEFSATVSPAIKSMGIELGLYNLQAKPANEALEKFQDIVDDFDGDQVDTLKAIKEQLVEIATNAATFSDIGSSMAILGQESTNIGDNLANGIKNLNSALGQIDSERLQVLEKIASFSADQISKLKEANTIKLEADKNSFLGKLAEALEKGGTAIQIVMEGEKVAQVVFNTELAANAIAGAFRVKK